jgi:hypothetical protein
MVKHGIAPFLECSSRGDKRFSAFYAKVGEKTIEERYQSYKIFEDGSTGLSIKEAKGRKPVNHFAAAVYYEGLWRIYLAKNPQLFEVLQQATGLSDIFGEEGHCCQATVLWKIKNEQNA